VGSKTKDIVSFASTGHDEVVRDLPAARARVEDAPDSGFDDVHLAKVFRHAISPSEY
jgi:hypothetical protein